MRFDTRQRGVICLSLAALVATATPLATAQTFPVKPVRFVVPFAPGGGTDLLARAIGCGSPTCSGSRWWSTIAEEPVA